MYSQEQINKVKINISRREKQIEIAKAEIAELKLNLADCEERLNNIDAIKKGYQKILTSLEDGND